MVDLLYSLSNSLSGTEALSIMLAGILGVLLIWDARRNGHPMNERNK
jgi:hypothetical protein